MCILVVLRKRVEEDRLAAVEVSGTFVGRNTIRPISIMSHACPVAVVLMMKRVVSPHRSRTNTDRPRGSNSSLESRSI